NVSFYNQSPDGPVYPTPTIGMVGLVENMKKRMSLSFKDDGDIIYLVGDVTNDIASSEYLHKIHGIEFSPAPYFDLEKEYDLQQTISELIQNEEIASAHDVSEGGLFVTLAESGFENKKGFKIKSLEKIRKDAFLFGEGQSRVVVSVKNDKEVAFKARLGGISFLKLGNVSGKDINIDEENWGNIIQWKELYEYAIEKQLSKELEVEGALGML
ncbi:MAG: phosphoribosylformylglycinamidine synthase subunit PurL, partial [Flavisolibacter sp.]|nr:phosphoribosylformylglycinamidine synthase subunit PurL [Flavisolibacter sp.]